MQGYARQGLGRSVSHKKGDKQGLPLAASLTVRARLGSLRRTVCRTRSAPRNDRSRGLTLPHRGFANASTDANGKNDRTNCNQEIFHGAPQCCRAVCTASKSPCGCISATHSQLRRGRPHAKEIAGKSLELIGGTAIPLFNDASMASSGGAAYWPSRIKTSRRLELQRTNWWELSHTLIRRREHGQHRSTD
jgi:hypothetical protein